MTSKNADYWAGYNAEAVRLAAKDRATAALDAHPNFHDLANEVAKQLRRDNARKQRVAAQFPGVAMDASGEESAREYATRVMKSLGLKVKGDFDPLDALDAYLVGRRSAADAAAGRRTSAQDCGDGTFMDKYLTP